MSAAPVVEKRGRVGRAEEGGPRESNMDTKKTPGLTSPSRGTTPPRPGTGRVRTWGVVLQAPDGLTTPGREGGLRPSGISSGRERQGTGLRTR